MLTCSPLSSRCCKLDRHCRSLQVTHGFWVLQPISFQHQVCELLPGADGHDWQGATLSTTHIGLGDAEVLQIGQAL